MTVETTGNLEATLRPQRFSPRARDGGQQHFGRSRHLCHNADWSRQIHLLPNSSSNDGRAVIGGISPYFADERSGGSTA